MPTPKKKIMGRGESSVTGIRSATSSSSKKSVVKVQPKPDTKAEPRSNVRKRRSVVSEGIRQGRNKAEVESVKDAKSGKTARVKAQEIKDMNKYGNVKKQPTKKITGK